MFCSLNMGMRGHDTPARTPEELGETLQALGASHVQLIPRKSFPALPWTPSQLTPAMARYLGQTLRQRGIHVSVLGCYINPVDQDEAARREALEWFKANLRFAKYLGADLVGTETGIYRTPEETHTEENYQRLLASMRELVDCAEKLGVTVGVEPVRALSLSSPELTRRLLDDLNSPNIAIIFDPVNLLENTTQAHQHEVMDKMFRLCGDRISVLHLKDCGSTEAYLAEPGYGKGEFDFPYLFRLVAQHTPCIDAVLEQATWETFAKDRAFIQKVWQETAVK